MVLCIVKFPAVVSVVWRIFARFRGTVSIDSADCKNAFSVLFGSVLEHLAVNRSVVGSSPTGGAHKARKFNVYGFYLFLQPALGGKIDRLLKKAGIRLLTEK